MEVGDQPKKILQFLAFSLAFILFSIFLIFLEALYINILTNFTVLNLLYCYIYFLYLNLKNTTKIKTLTQNSKFKEILNFIIYTMKIKT